jgi:hypothetical protein
MMNSPQPTIEECFTHLTLWRDALVSQHERVMVINPRWPGSPSYRSNAVVTRQRLYDAFFFIIALRNFWRAADLVAARLGDEANGALNEFASCIPDAATLRNIIEHFDAYIEGKGRKQTVREKAGDKAWGASLNAWLQALPNWEHVLKVTDGFTTYKVDLEMAMRAAEMLYITLSKFAFGRVKYMNEP